MDILILCLVLLGVAQGLLLQLVAEHGTGLLFGALAAAVMQLVAIWVLRKHFAEAATKAVLHLPSPALLMTWTTISLVAVGVAALIDFVLPTHELSLHFRHVAEHWAGWVLVAFLGPIAEEIVFRAIAIEWLRQKLSARASVVCAAALFGITHGDLRTSLLAFGVGLVFGAAYVKTRSIVPGTIAHVVNNTVGLTLVARLGGG